MRSVSSPKLLSIGFHALILMSVLFLSSCGGQDERTIHFQVRKGLAAREIARDLHDHGLLRHPATFLVWAKLLGANRIRPGLYDIPVSESGLTMYNRFRKGPPLVRVTFPEGWMAKQMAAQLESQGVTNAQEFMAIVARDKREGFLFPDTYFFDQEISATRVVERMTARFEEKKPKDFAEQAKALKLTELQLVTLASLVEKEARASEERPVIAGIFLNRLRKRWLLESCATVEYALGGWRKKLYYKDLGVNSPYNTYRNPGLPPGPIANPGAAALEAAAHPTPTDMMFFVADGNGTHVFSRYYKDHINAKKKRP